MITTSIIYDHKKKNRPNGEGPVEVRIIQNRKSWYVSTGIRVHPSELVGGCIVNRADADELNKRLLIIYTRVCKEANAALEASEDIDVAKIRRSVWRTVEKVYESPTSVLDFIEEQTSLLQVSEGTKLHYATLRTRLLQFGQIMQWHDLTTENIIRWDAWLHNLERPLSDAEEKAGKAPQRIGDGAVYNYHKNLKAMINRAVLLGKISENPYNRLRGKIRRGDKPNVEFLTNDEMTAIESQHPVPGTMMAVARDLFVFQMHTGMSYADTQAFDFSQYKRIDGKWVNVGRRVKTGVQYIAMLTEECERILESYNWQLPKMGNADYNHCLKALGMAAGVTTPLHSHLARHSFATRAKAAGNTIENISKMLGHANIQQTQRYAKILPEQVFADLRSLEQTIKKNKKK